MRSGKWILAVCGTVGLAWSVGTAEERAPGTQSFLFNSDATPKREVQYFSRSGQTATHSGPGEQQNRNRQGDSQTSEFVDGPFPSRYVRSSDSEAERSHSSTERREAVPQVRNYHQELFGTERPSKSPREPESPFATQMPPETRSRVQQAAHQEDKETGFTKSDGPLPDESKLPTGADNPDFPSGVVHAEYERSKEQNRGQFIEQVRATGDAPLPPVSQAVRSEHPDSRVSLARGIEAASTGNVAPSVTLEWGKRGDVNVGQVCHFELIVKNTGNADAHHVEVEAFFPATVRLTDAKPLPNVHDNSLSWDFEMLAPGEENIIEISMIPSRRGDLTTSAFVRFTGANAGVFTVEEPLIQVAVNGPQEVMVGDPAPHLIEISNPGTGIAQNVVIEALIPDGLEHPRGERLLMKVGALNPGESRQVRLALAAVKGGEHRIQVQVAADSSLRQVAETEINVIAPSLEVAVDGPGLRYKGRSAKYRLTVSNDGGADSNNVRVRYQVPEGFRFVRADRGGEFDKSSGTVQWFVGQLSAQQSTQLNVELLADEIGSHVHQVVAVSEHGTRAESQVETRVEGTASLVLEIVDQNDPVEIGVETAYEIRVRNEGTKAAQNVSVSCELPPGVELVNVKAPAAHREENGLLLFKPLEELAPGKTALFQVHVRGTLEGNHRFRARLASDSIQEPLIFEELTKFYAE